MHCPTPNDQANRGSSLDVLSCHPHASFCLVVRRRDRRMPPPRVNTILTVTRLAITLVTTTLLTLTLLTVTRHTIDGHALTCYILTAALFAVTRATDTLSTVTILADTISMVIFLPVTRLTGTTLVADRGALVSPGESCRIESTLRPSWRNFLGWTGVSAAMKRAPAPKGMPHAVAVGRTEHVLFRQAASPSKNLLINGRVDMRSAPVFPT